MAITNLLILKRRYVDIMVSQITHQRGKKRLAPVCQPLCQGSWYQPKGGDTGAPETGQAPCHEVKQ